MYAFNVSGLDTTAFRLNVLYQDPSAGTKRYLPQSDPTVSGTPLISILRADRLNNNNDPQPDGNYDFMNGFTVLQQQGKLFFRCCSLLVTIWRRLHFRASQIV